MTIYIVKSGDTLWRISRTYNVSIDSIVETNGIKDPNRLIIGQSLVIPTPDNVHVVKAGETLWQISRMYNVSIPDILGENNIPNPNLIYVGQRIVIPKPAIEVNGYLTETGPVGVGILEGTGDYLTYFAMFSYRITAGGDLTMLDDASVIDAARSKGVIPLMCLTNFEGRGFSSDLAHTFLSSPAVQERALSNIVNTMKEKGYQGLNIDFEYVYPQDRELYNAFLQRAADRMHANGFSISTALAPKVRADQPGLLYEAHDYPAHGRIVDFVVLMTYEWGWAGGPPWAIAPINEVRRVLDYAVTVIPRNKILMGIPLYGRDWKLPYVAGTTIAETVSYNEAIDRALRHGVPIQYNTVYQSPFYRYWDESGAEHEVWFDDARSYQAKYDTIRQYGLRGASYWALNLQTPPNWPVLVGNFRVLKY
ncbi:LysM peptidoglycan-binding domain-containing protein [Lutispora saccharofermentans]|uniref:LysM peptidoglycan-binding domain-containing protein n=1 Tax=Lutispora saccharofermentans TaxID=3024236 RepID=A0ABT1NAF3_9FIRM|nr:LysM peptidoglycan-binding domain-containing protein [Lutispora saccharofermentans]MCQ1528237.1 LysM peptidoglycan-binding domain-containing protein [Lutispora saccharofermentans]